MTSRRSAAQRVGAPVFSSPQSSRGRAIAAAAGDPLPPPAATVVPTADVSFNPDNPREELGDVSDLAASFAEVGQIVAVTIATADAYLASRPDRRNDLDTGARYVVIDGNRRLKAAREAGLSTIKVMLADEFASTDERLLEAAFIANAKRKDLSELEEAQALQRLVTFYGSQHKAAKRLGMSQPLISQKLSLLALTPELQADLEAGRRNVSHLRNMTKVPPEEQRNEADRRARADADKKKQRATRQIAPSQAGDNSVITPTADPTQEAAEPLGDNSVIASASEPRPQGAAITSGVPQQTSATTRSNAPHLPWNDLKALDRILREHMTEEDRLTLAKLLAE